MPQEKRAGDARDPCAIEATILLAPEAPAIPCLVSDISAAGARLQIASADALADQFTLALPLVGDHKDKRLVKVCWRDGKSFGVRFVGRA
jgi:hypothetical protein